MPVDHYENFPVASLLLPKRLRQPIEAIYRFARAADDLADEGNASPEERLTALSAFGAELAAIAASQPSTHPVFAPLAPVIQAYGLPVGLFEDLLSAFSQDVHTTRYADEARLTDYCRRSANPVGRLVLLLVGIRDPVAFAQSDAICTALQRINFWQDVAIDWQKGRIYLPQETMARFGVQERDVQGCAEGQPLAAPLIALLRFEVESARALMLSGTPLLGQLSGRLQLEIALTVEGGLRILEKIEKADYDVFRQRPVLGLIDWLILLPRAFWRVLFS
ncbi:MAG: squalene synthase HpnC [Zoogloeaceae bacterium]|nr:squalene synthase HpnC [Zoogloeaceae bacterium]